MKAPASSLRFIFLIGWICRTERLAGIYLQAKGATLEKTNQQQDEQLVIIYSRRTRFLQLEFQFIAARRGGAQLWRAAHDFYRGTSAFVQSKAHFFAAAVSERIDA